MTCQVGNSVCLGVRLVAPLEDLQQLEQAGTAEVELRVHAVQVHTALPLPGLVQSTDPHITLISLQPRILLVENFLSAIECQASSWSLTPAWSSSSLLSPESDLVYSALPAKMLETSLLRQKACQLLTALKRQQKQAHFSGLQGIIRLAQPDLRRSRVARGNFAFYGMHEIVLQRSGS